MLKHYVTYYYPGSFVSESSSKEIRSRNHQDLEIPNGAYAYYFFDREEVEQDGELLKGPAKNESGTFFIDAELYTLERVKEELPHEETLISNMELNEWSAVVKTRQGMLPFDLNKDTIVKSRRKISQ